MLGLFDCRLDESVILDDQLRRLVWEANSNGFLLTRQDKKEMRSANTQAYETDEGEGSPET